MDERSPDPAEPLESAPGDGAIGPSDGVPGDGGPNDAATAPSEPRRPWARPTPDDREPADVDRLIDELTAEARVRAAAVTAETAALVDAVAALRPYEGRLGVTWRRWVEWQLGLTTAEARRICTLADKLAKLPVIDAAFRSGELSEGVTEVLARVATPANEGEVMAVAAKVATGAQLQQLARDYRQVRDGARPVPDPADAPSEASWSWDHRGRFRGSWNLRPDDGATLESALESALAHLRPSEDDIDGDHLAAAATVAEGALGPDERARARRVDALLAMAEDAQASEADDGLLPEASQVIVHRNIGPTGTVDADGRLRFPELPDLHRPPDDAGAEAEIGAGVEAEAEVEVEVTFGPATIPGCGSIAAWLADKVACGALCITVEMIGGFPVSQPTAVRPFNRRQRRAMRARDRHCRFPGCTRTRHLHAHHVDEWHPTRRTTIARAVLLCGYHHALVHRKGYTIELGVDFVTTVTRPDGSILRSVALPPPDPACRARAEPDDPPPDRRTTGTGEPLTTYARDVLVESWCRAGASGSGGPGPPPEPEVEPDAGPDSQPEPHPEPGPDP